jgi:hypothetical protein
MAILAFVTEYQRLPVQAGQAIQAGMEPGLKNASSPLTVTTHVESAAFNAQTNFIRVHIAGGNVCYACGPAASATTSDGRMPADHTEILGVRPGDVISFVTASQ